MANRLGLSIVDRLTDLLGADRVVADPDIVDGYRQDRASHIDSGWPVAVVRARTTDDVVKTLQFASEHHTPVVTRGAGTGLSGGANAINGGIVLSTASMNQILQIDEAQQTATVQCGVLNGDLAAAAATRGLWYPPDPASRDISTIGGNIATNAGGPCCLKYGVTADHVSALTAVLADGTIIHTGGLTRKNVAGLDLTRLLVGSEGILAVVVEAVLRLRIAPRPSATLVASFPATADAGDAVLRIGCTVEPSLLELMDQTTIAAVESMTRMGLDTDAGALLLAQSDGPRAAEDIERCIAACTAAGASEIVHTIDPTEGEMFLAARRAALPALERMGDSILDDVAVPKPCIPQMLEAIKRIGKRHQIVIGTFGHAGDGNLHPTIIFERQDPASQAAAQAAFEDILSAATALGGTVTGEHGVGSLKQRYLADMIGANELALMGRIKSAFDPMGILNTGKAI
jgi:glycolate oxidase